MLVTDFRYAKARIAWIQSIVFVLALLLGGCTTYVAHKPVSEEYVSTPAAEILPGASALTQQTLPIVFTFPIDYVRKQFMANSLNVTLVGSRKDVDQVAESGRPLGISRGVFDIALSMNVGFNPNSRKFTGEDDPRILEQLKGAGYSNIVQKRLDAKGVPIYETIAEKTDRHIYLLYIAIGNTGSVIKVNYTTPDEYTSRDQEIWDHFIGGFGN